MFLKTVCHLQNASTGHDSTGHVWLPQLGSSNHGSSWPFIPYDRGGLDLVTDTVPLLCIFCTCFEQVGGFYIKSICITLTSIIKVPREKGIQNLRDEFYYHSLME